MLGLSAACMLFAALASPVQETGPANSVGSLNATDKVTAYGPVLRLIPSAANTFVARGTLPLPPGVPWSPHCPFGLRREGVVYPCQWWPVAFHADGSTSVVELAATVAGIDTVDPSDPWVEYEIVTSAVPYPLEAPGIDSGITSLMLLSGNVRLRVLDSLGNRYEASLSLPVESGESILEVLGRARGVYYTRGLLGLQGGAPDALPFLGGFHAWFTVNNAGHVVELDLRWHNSVWNPGGPMAPDVIFEKVELLLPDAWAVEPRWPMPTAGLAYGEPEGAQPIAVFPLIEAGPTPHLLRQRGHLTWRVVLYRPGDEEHAVDAIKRRGWGTVRGEERGWQDPTTMAWTASQTATPDLSAWEPGIGQTLLDDRAALEQALADGTPYFYAGGLGALGPYHPIGVPYGGLTGGNEIFQTHGTDVLWTGQPAGLVAEEIRHRMVMDRQFGWFYGLDSALVDAFDLVDPSGDLPVNVFDNDFIEIDTYGALGFELAPDLYADVQPRPTYEDTILGTTPYNGLEQHDAQHGVRATYPLKTLVWAANDRMARHDLIAQAALWHMQLHDGPSGRLRFLKNWAQQHPNVAGEFGRGEAWMLDGIATWYALSWPGTREHLNDWFALALETVATMRTPLDVFYGNRTGKVIDAHEFDEQYAVIQWYEHGILLQALAALRQSWAVDPLAITVLEDLIVDGALATWRYGWKPGTNGPWAQQAVAWIDPNLAAFAGLAEIPPDGFGGDADNSQIAGPLGLAARYANLVQRQELEAAAAAVAGTSDPLDGFEALTPYFLNLENRAPLLAWLQLIEDE